MRLELSHRLIGRLLQLALLVLLGAQVPMAAAQNAGIFYSGQGTATPRVTENRQTNTRIVVDFWDNGGRFLGNRFCYAPGNCNYLPPAGTARYAMVVEYDANREELVGEACGGVVSTVPQGQCINGPLRVTMRLRHGLVKWQFIADERPGRLYAPRYGSFGSNARLEFPNTDGTAAGAPKYWEPQRFTFTDGGYPTAVGDYDIKMPQMSGACQPVRTNPSERLTVREGQTTEFIVRYTGTVCTMTIVTYSTPPEAGTLSSNPVGLNCTAQAYPACRAQFPFDSTVRLIAHPAAGWQAHFGRVLTGCSNAEPDYAVCEILADGDRELSPSFGRITTTPPPPPPVTLSVALGPATPADATVATGSNSAALMQLLLTPANGAARLRAITLQASGNGRDDLDLTELRIHRDSNGNGLVDAGEASLGRGRFTSDNGTLRLVLDTPLEFSEATALVVTADIATTVHTAALAGGVLMALGLLGFVVPIGGRPAPARLWLPLVLAAAACLAACGGDGGTTPAETAQPTAPPATPPATPPDPVPPTPVVVTYRVQATAVEATDAASTPATLTVTTLPLNGAVISVVQ